MEFDCQKALCRPGSHFISYNTGCFKCVRSNNYGTVERVIVRSLPTFDLSFHFIRKLISSAPRVLVSTVSLSSTTDTFMLPARAKIPLDVATRAKDIRPAKIFFCNPRLIKLPPYYYFCI